MSQNGGIPANEGQAGSGRTNSENVRNDERKRFEGFEGMNYEQVRGPYNPKKRDRNPGGGEPSEGGSARGQDSL